MASTVSRHRSGRSRDRKNSIRLLLVIHLLSLVLAACSIALFTATIPIWNSNFIHTSSSSPLFRGDWPDALPLLPLLTVLISSSIFVVRRLLTSRIRSYEKSRHKTHSTSSPTKLPIYLTISTLLLLLGFLILAAISGLYRFWRPSLVHKPTVMAQHDNTLASLSLSRTAQSSFVRLDARAMPSGDLTSTPLLPPSSTSPPTATVTQAPELPSSPREGKCSMSNLFTRQCTPTLYLLGDLQIAAITLGGLVWATQFFLVIVQIKTYQRVKRRWVRKQQHLQRSHKRLEDTSKHLDLEKAEQSNFSPATALSDHPTRPTLVHLRSTSSGSTSTTNSTDSSSTDTSSALRSKPKQHYYDPRISPSRSLSQQRAQINASQSQIPVSFNFQSQRV